MQVDPRLTHDAYGYRVGEYGYGVRFVQMLVQFCTDTGSDVGVQVDAIKVHVERAFGFSA